MISPLIKLAEKKLPSSIPYSKNEVALHTDESIMPKNKLTQATWNYNVDNTDDMPIALTYNMNILQNLKTQQTVLVTLNENEIRSAHNAVKRFKEAIK